MWLPVPTAATLIRNARLGLGAERRDVVLRDGVVAAVAVSGSVHDGGSVHGAGGSDIDAGGGVLLPGLVDHHLHLGAWLRARRSIPLGTEGLAATLGTMPPDRRGWRVVFGLDHQHDITAALRAVAAVASPCLVVHRTGHASLFNAAAARLLDRGRSAGIDHGRGLWGRALGPVDPEWEQDQLRWLARDLLAQGVVAVQDATPYPESALGRCGWLRRHLAPVRVDFMADPGEPLRSARWIKLFPRDLAGVPPAMAALAVHAVEPAEIVDALDLLGSLAPGQPRPHRIEHAALCPPAVQERIAAVGCQVCANPGFLVERADALTPLSRTGEDAFLHPVAELVDAGVPVRFGSDAPVTRPGVWSAVAGAWGRGGHIVPFAGPRVSLATALAAVVRFPVPQRPERWIGQPADLVLVDERRLTDPSTLLSAAAPSPDPLSDAAAPSPVLATVVNGRLAFRRGDRPS